MPTIDIHPLRQQDRVVLTYTDTTGLAFTPTQCGLWDAAQELFADFVILVNSSDLSDRGVRRQLLEQARELVQHFVTIHGVEYRET